MKSLFKKRCCDVILPSCPDWARKIGQLRDGTNEWTEEQTNERVLSSRRHKEGTVMRVSCLQSRVL